MNIRKVRNSFAVIVALVMVAAGPMKVFAVENDTLSAKTEKDGEQTADVKESSNLPADVKESNDRSTDTEESSDLPEEAEEDSDQSTEAVGSIILPTDAVEEDIISVDLPTLQEDEESPFDFFIDPQKLLFETDAAMFGGGVVEKEANLLFHNRMEGKYDFSRNSDRLNVTNQSTVPVEVTISARITNADDLQITQDKDFPKDDLPYVYLALVDDKGNEQPVSEDGEVSINVRMQRAPENAYVYTWDSETGNYEYGLSGAPEDIDFDTYSFGLTGKCSSDADWSNVSAHPKITVTWHVEPLLTEQKTEEDED